MEGERLFDERVSIRDSARPLKKYGSISNLTKKDDRYIKHVMVKGDTLQGIALKYGVTMEKIRRVNRLFTSDSLFLREYLYIPITIDSPFYESGALITEISPPNYRASIGGMPSNDFPPGSPDEKQSFDDFLNKVDTSLADIKKHVEKSKENSEFVKDLNEGFVRHKPTARLRQSASLGATSYNTQFFGAGSGMGMGAAAPPQAAVLTQGARVNTSLQRLERAHDDLFQL